MCLYSHTTHSSNSIYPNFQLSQYNHPAYLTNHLVLLSPSLAVCPSQGGEGGGGGAAVTVAATLVSRHHLDQHWNRGDAGDFYPVHQHIRIDILVGWIEPILSTMPIKILFTSVSRRLFKAALRLKKTWFFFIQLKIIGDQGLGGNGKAASKKDLESEYKLWIRRNVNKGRMWGNNDILPLFRKWVVNILKTSTCNLHLERLSQTTKETGSRVWAYLGKKNNGVFSSMSWLELKILVATVL